MLRRLTVLCCLALLLAACAPDPRDVADAYETTVLADQQAADQAQSRDQQAERHALQLEIGRAAQAEREQALRELVKWSGRAGVVAAVLAILALGASFSFGAYRLQQVLVSAFGEFVHTRARLIPLSKATRQFPLVMLPLGGGKYSLTDINTGITTMLDVRNPAEMSMVAMSGLVRHAGALGQEARRCDRPEGVAAVSSGTVIPLREFVETWKERE